MPTMKISELRKLSDAELRRLALQRHKSGRRKSTTTALRAQYVLWDRYDRPFQSEAHFLRDHAPTGVRF